MKRFALWLCAFALAAPGAARAEEHFVATFPPVRRVPHFMLEFKLGPYSPDIDGTSGLTGTPFADLFNNQFTTPPGQRPGGKILFTIEFDWEFWRRWGSLSLGGSLGFQHRTTHAFEYSPGQGAAACTVPNCVRAGDTTSLTFFPIELLLVYRFDYLALRYRYMFPLVPYVKTGIAYYFWFIQNGSGGIATSLPAADGSVSHGIGGTLGLVAEPGLAIMLDALDPPAATSLRTELNIDHVYAFFELNYAWITGLGFANKMDFSDTTWNAGLGFEF